MGAREPGRDTYARMMSPLRVGAHVLRNRVIMGSMHTRLETEPDPIGKQVAFYAERARGEAAPSARRLLTQ